MSGNQPNTSLYINNLNDKINKEELRAQLYALFTTYGKIIDVIATKSAKMRGQAFLVFTDLAGATSALRACEGMVFYDKPMHIDYAKSKSWATLKREDPAFVAPNSAHATQAAQHAGRITISSDKRPRDEEMADGERQTKQQKADDDDDEEMEIDDEEEAGQPSAPFTSASVPPTSQQPTSRLLCTNLPQEVTDSVLTILLEPRDGFKSCQVLQSPAPNAQGVQVKMAQALFKSVDFATAAKEALDGYTLKKGWKMSVAFI
ncbi:RNA-binding domain-containing protein [Athelia psychrophila]|uniref:RNA-binding domain-containing protein n=1 Tax=Athelia psychrophila TaxID=1759441 RepID=A0A166VMG2_9AGAM|nr:RNA-binding domain-containing protein [Fibularhizoctonia sp. CBS 109695]